MSYVLNRKSRVCAFLILSALAIAAVACGSGVKVKPVLSQLDATVPPATGTPPGNSVPPSTPVPPNAPNTYPQVITGWPKEYSAHIQTRVLHDYPELLGLSDLRMGTVCPKWHGLDRGEREKFWPMLIYSIAGAESGRTRTAIYRETTMSIDPVTHQQIRSEGLLQLSYVDLSNYKYLEGDISWEKDRVAALADYADGRKLGTPTRTILNAYANLNLGLYIMHRLVKLYSLQDLDSAFGHYWSTMRTSGTGFPKVLKDLKTQMPECFK